MKYTNEELIDMYGDFKINFLPIKYFSWYYEIDLDSAMEIILKGKKLYDNKEMKATRHTDFKKESEVKYRRDIGYATDYIQFVDDFIKKNNA